MISAMRVWKVTAVPCCGRRCWVLQWTKSEEVSPGIVLDFNEQNQV